MNTRLTIIIVLVLVLAATIAGLSLWNRLPDQIASHWNVNDRWMVTCPKSGVCF
jgi:uncharacterized membrane protein